MDKPNIDWGAFKDFPMAQVFCVCGAIYRSHAKCVNTDNGLTHYTELPCPQCGQDYDHARRISHDEPELWVIGGGG